MGRSQAELEQAIDISMDVFRREGYERTGIEKLVDATGLNRYAIYQHFGGKRELFLAALQRDNDLLLEAIKAKLEAREKTVLETLREFIQGPLNELVDSDQMEFAGSLVCQATFELSPHDPEVAECVEVLMNKKLAQLAEVFELAREDGSLREGIKPKDAARLFMTTMYALTALSQCIKGRDHIEESMEATIAILSSNPS